MQHLFVRTNLYRSNELRIFAVVAETATDVFVEAADEVFERPGERIVAEPVATGPRRAAVAVQLVPCAGMALDGDGRDAVGILNGGTAAVSVVVVVSFVVVEKLTPFITIERGERRVVAQLSHSTAISVVVPLHQLLTPPLLLLLLKAMVL